MPKNRAADIVIAMAERCYDLDTADADWFRRVLAAGLPLLDHGLGVVGFVFVKPPAPGRIEIVDVCVPSGPEDFPIRHAKAFSTLPPELLHRETQHARVATLSERSDILAVWTRQVDYAKDALGITALDPDGHGLQIMAPLPRVTKLIQYERELWQMLAAHLSASHRLRRALRKEQAESRSTDRQRLPRGAEAVIEPKSFEVVEAVGDASKTAYTKVLREKAIAIDEARVQLRAENPVRALKIWSALVRGRWSIVDHFDSDDRRYVLAIPNPPHITDPRGLSDREEQVIAYARLGMSHAHIGYHLGISRSTVTKALASAMRKLGVSTQAELVAKLRGVPTPGLEEPA